VTRSLHRVDEDHLHAALADDDAGDGHFVAHPINQQPLPRLTSGRVVARPVAVVVRPNSGLAELTRQLRLECRASRARHERETTVEVGGASLGCALDSGVSPAFMGFKGTTPLQGIVDYPKGPGRTPQAAVCDVNECS
jgi:hypothetical protein